MLSSDEDEDIPPKKKVAAVSKSSGKPRTSMSKTKSRNQEEDSDFEMESPESDKYDEDAKEDEVKKPVKRKSMPKNAEATSSKGKTEKSKHVRDADTAPKEPTKKFECVTLLPLANSRVSHYLTCTAGLRKKRLDSRDLWHMARNKFQMALLMLCLVYLSYLQGN